MIAKETARRIGAVSGLVIGILMMWTLGFSGILASAIFGASFCVVGAIAAEKWHASNR